MNDNEQLARQVARQLQGERHWTWRQVAAEVLPYVLTALAATLGTLLGVMVALLLFR